MNDLRDLGINLLASFIGGLGVWAYQRFRRWQRNKGAKRFWRPFIEHDLQFVVGVHEEFPGWEPSGFIGVGTALALRDLQADLTRVGFADIPVMYDKSISGDSLRTSLIALGGPDVNSISKAILQRVNTTVRAGDPAGDPERHNVAFYDESNEGKPYVPKKRGGIVDLDYGLLLRVVNPFNPDAQVLLLAGSFGFGTWAGARLLEKNEFLKEPIVSGGQPFECLYSADVEQNTPQIVRPVILRPLSDPAVPSM